jgi:hypothetical protein
LLETTTAGILRFAPNDSVRGLFRSLQGLLIRFSLHPSAIGDAGENIGFLEARVFRQEFALANPAGKLVQNQRHPDAMAADAGLPETNVGINRDAGKQFVSRHICRRLLPCIIQPEARGLMKLSLQNQVPAL